ncbi:LysR family transcriptional regulator [Microbacterium azadirachtae]|jgi:DNA-binding transcriptional LysR family regulator|uniref:DNA-binding transcriptional regulator, LysR family n=1 Tax=Microbacterium azadirachtae TaxID=582680 RepID=A0A1I6FQW9_9MICO|nr:LysR family transcriptional regulator [Microbacterium azadirachtae]SDL17345.1 DNA-binding transcriptional regulator, LysR family [Microbacterium azadirachtae]SEF47417.1 DNA-binding transcriptional regulator, LysR family [Microbacterium azadirachtae]SEF47438.1 DNA-binding transcriptional regulator, LysR family [Microbacterium azadirachtae]SFR32316.1 DNA-binding transcriptional regulator, LysR family [Microbacterium azadirachtae]
MQLQQLQILRELGALGSVTAVAEALRVTPSAVSQQLAALQRGVRAPLTRKQGRTLVLTPAGEALAEAGAAALDAMAAARSAVDEFEAAEGGVVTISGFLSAAQALFGPLLRELGSGPDVPAIRFTDEDVAQSDFPALTARYDLVLAHRMEHSPPWPKTGIRVLTLAAEPLDVALSPEHPLAQRASLQPSDVVGERWVTSRAGYSPDDVLRTISAITNRPAEIVHRINDYGVAASVIATGDVIGVLPRYTSPGTDAVVRRPLQYVSTNRMIDVLARPENLRRRSVRLTADALGRVMTRLAR